MTKKTSTTPLDELSWANIPAGNRVRYIWQEWLQNHFERYYGGHLLTVDSLTQSLNLPTNGFDFCVNLGTQTKHNVHAQVNALPIQADSLSAGIFSFTLDYCEEPSLVLGEMHRALAPEGYLYTLLYVPNNGWLFHSKLPWTTTREQPRQTIALARYKEWLNLLGFEIDEVQAVTCPWWKGFKKFEQQEESHRTWFSTPVAYMIRAQKKIPTMTPFKHKKNNPALALSGALANVKVAHNKLGEQ